MKLLANQQEDGDGLIQNIVKNLGEVSRKGLTEVLRNFIQVDNQRALKVGHLREGLTSFLVRRPKGEEGHPEVPVRESPDDLTLGTEETLGSRASKSTTLQKRVGVLLWWVLTGTPPSAKRDTKGIKGKDWEELYDASQEMSRAKKPQEARKQMPSGK